MQNYNNSTENGIQKIVVLVTGPDNEDFLALVRLLDADLAGRYGEMQKQYEKYNSVMDIDKVIVAYKGDVAAACGAFKKYDASVSELKRVYVREDFRNLGLAKLVVSRIEELASENGYRYMVLETGVKQTEAVRLYQKLGYEVIENYGSYIGNSNSICMRKALNDR